MDTSPSTDGRAILGGDDRAHSIAFEASTRKSYMAIHLNDIRERPFTVQTRYLCYYVGQLAARGLAVFVRTKLLLCMYCIRVTEKGVVWERKGIGLTCFCRSSQALQAQLDR